MSSCRTTQPCLRQTLRSQKVACTLYARHSQDVASLASWPHASEPQH